MNISDNFNNKLKQSLPHNFLAERLVLGSILTNPDSIIVVSQHLNIESFYLKTHQVIYKAALAVYGEGKKTDYVTIVTWLQDNKLTEYVKDLSILIDFINQTINVTYLEDYLALIYEKYLRRLLIQFGYETIGLAHSTEIPLEQIFEKLEKKLFLVNNQKEQKLLSSSAEILTQILSEIREKLTTKKLPGLLSSFSDLDTITQGFYNSDLIIIAGRPSMGKTAFSLTLAKNIAQSSKLNVIFFSLEMKKEQLLYRLLSTETLIQHTKLRSGRVSKEEWININRAISVLSNLTLYIDDTPNILISEMLLKIKHLKQQKDEPIGAVFIDYLQLLEDLSKTENRVQELSKITRSLKKLARELNVPVFVMSQLSRNVETRLHKRPILSDLRESGSIEQDADVVMMLYREDYYNNNSLEKNILEITVAKHRNGAVGTAKLKFNLSFLLFENNS
jgi:replicative DNA helicase